MATDRFVPCIWRDDQAEAAASFYVAAFGEGGEGRVDAVARYPRSGENPANKPTGSVLTVDFTVAGQRFMLLNGGPNSRPNPSVSFHVHLPDAAAVDALHATLGEGGMDLMPLDAYPWSPRFVWLQDRFGVSGQLMAREAIAAYAAALPGSRVLHVEDFGEGEGARWAR